MKQPHPPTIGGSGHHRDGPIGLKTSKSAVHIPSVHPAPSRLTLDTPDYEDLARMNPIDLANRMVFGFSGFRAPQRDIIQAAVQVRRGSIYP